MATYEFKTQEDIDTKSRTIVKKIPVPASEVTAEFTLEQKENELANAQQSVLDAQDRVKQLEAEIAEIKEALSIK